MDRVKYMRGEIEDTDFMSPKPPEHGDTWGRWKLNGNGKHWSLDLEDYWISIDQIRTNAQMNDWIFQMAGKLWVTPDDLGNLVLALQDIFDPQGTMCGNGVDKCLLPDYVNGVLGKPIEERGDEEHDKDESTPANG